MLSIAQERAVRLFFAKLSIMSLENRDAATLKMVIFKHIHTKADFFSGGNFIEITGQLDFYCTNYFLVFKKANFAHLHT